MGTAVIVEQSEHITSKSRGPGVPLRSLRVRTYHFNAQESERITPKSGKSTLIASKSNSLSVSFQMLAVPNVLFQAARGSQSISHQILAVRAYHFEVQPSQLVTSKFSCLSIPLESLVAMRL